MTFGEPEWLWGLLLIPLLIALFVRAEHRGLKRLQQFVSARLLPQLAGTVNRRRRIIRFALLLLGLALAIVSLAQPRWGYTFEDFSPAFRSTPLAHFFADLFAERNVFGDVDTIIAQFQAYQQPEPEGHHANVACPAIILTGSEDNTHRTAFALKKRIDGCEMKILYGAGHACQI